MCVLVVYGPVGLTHTLTLTLTYDTCMTLLNYRFEYWEDCVGLVALIVPEALLVRLNPGITDVSAAAREPVVPDVSAGWQHQWWSLAGAALTLRLDWCGGHGATIQRNGYNAMVPQPLPAGRDKLGHIGLYGWTGFNV